MSSNRSDLKLDWCSHEAAEYACRQWHYSKTMPSGKVAKVGVWEEEQFIGVVLFGSGATQQIGMPYGLTQHQVCELVRVALDAHHSPASRIVAIAIRLVKSAFRGLRLIVSYSDLNQGHLGGIYQAGNWLFVGKAKDHAGAVVLHGRQHHGRSIVAKYGTRNLDWLRKHVDPNARHAETEGKLKYLMPLDDEMRQKLLPLSKPYPKRAGSVTPARPANLQGGGGSSPTSALHSQDEDT